MTWLKYPELDPSSDALEIAAYLRAFPPFNLDASTTSWTAAIRLASCSRLTLGRLSTQLSRPTSKSPSSTQTPEGDAATFSTFAQGILQRRAAAKFLLCTER